jgi:pyruvate dehydrogenase (quinone)
VATVSEYVIDRLLDWVLHRLYGYYPGGDGIGGFGGARGQGGRDGKAFE